MPFTERQQFRAEYMLTALDNGVDAHQVIALVKLAEEYVFGYEPAPQPKPVSKDQH